MRGHTRLKLLKSLVQSAPTVLTATKLPFVNHRQVLGTLTVTEGPSGGSAGPLWEIQ